MPVIEPDVPADIPEVPLADQEEFRRQQDELEHNAGTGSEIAAAEEQWAIAKAQAEAEGGAGPVPQEQEPAVSEANLDVPAVDAEEFRRQQDELERMKESEEATAAAEATSQRAGGRRQGNRNSTFDIGMGAIKDRYPELFDGPNTSRRHIWGIST